MTTKQRPALFGRYMGRQMNDGDVILLAQQIRESGKWGAKSSAMERLRPRLGEVPALLMELINLRKEKECGPLCVNKGEEAAPDATNQPVMYCMEINGHLDPESASTSKEVIQGWVDEWNEDYPEVYAVVSLYRSK